MENTAIAWATHTFNPWMGCTKVSEGCKNCYAEAQADDRYHLVQWGPGNERRRTTPANWNKVRSWNKAAANLSLRPRVFCASWSDWADPEVPSDWRYDLWQLISECKNLDWLMLTKRSEMFPHFMPAGWYLNPWPHVWLGVSAENQRWWDDRVGRLKMVPAVRRFVSVEPMLGPIDMRLGNPGTPVDWVICGGESTQNARPMDPAWAMDLRDQCVQHGVPFFFKQWGEFIAVPASYPGLVHGKDDTGVLLGCRIDGKLYTECEYREDDQLVYVKVGKHKAGHRLDGVDWTQSPPSAVNSGLLFP